MTGGAVAPQLASTAAFTADEARKVADGMRRDVNEGRDPLAEKRDRRQAATVGDILDTYLLSEAFMAKAASTRITDKGRIIRHLKPLLGNIKVETLTPEAIARTQAKITQGKTAVREKTGPRGLARVRGGEGTARKAIRLLHSVFVWAVREKLANSNPAAGVKTGSDGSRNTILNDAEAYGRLFRTLDRMEAEYRVRREVADAIRVIALTGARRGEIAGMQWQHVDLKAGLVTLPASRHKTGKKIGKPRVIGLPAAAQAIVARQPAGNAHDFVFAPTHGKGPLTLTKMWNRVRVEAELPEGIGLHGLRHTLASHMAMAGAQASEIMTALGHRNLATSEGYVHWAKDARQAIAEKAAAVALAGMGSAPGDKVMPPRGGSL